MDDSKCRELIDRYITAYKTFDIDGMLALLSADVRFENYSGGQLTASTSGIDEFRQLAENSQSLFSEREQRLSSLQCYQDSATADIAYRGRLAETFLAALLPGRSWNYQAGPSSPLATDRSRKLSTTAESTPNYSFKPTPLRGAA